MHYAPTQNGIPLESAAGVIYTEAAAPKDLDRLVYCLWELKTIMSLPASFQYVIVPDACIDIVLDLRGGDARVMTPHVTSERIDLGTEFHYVGIRLRPGVYCHDVSTIVGNITLVSQLGDMPTPDIVRRLKECSFDEQQAELANVVRVMARDMLRENPSIAFIMDHIATLSVSDIAYRLGLSDRQLRRVVRSATGFSPRQLRTIVNFQHSFSADWTELYADQSHYIHQFKSITRHTPSQYQRTFDV